MPTPPFGTITLTVILESTSEGPFRAAVAELPGCFALGSTLEEARRNLIAAVEDYLVANRDFNLSEAQINAVADTVTIELRGGRPVGPPSAKRRVHLRDVEIFQKYRLRRGRLAHRA